MKPNDSLWARTLWPLFDLKGIKPKPLLIFTTSKIHNKQPLYVHSMLYGTVVIRNTLQMHLSSKYFTACCNIWCPRALKGL